ncbi:MAG TPA: LptF/LptG family permease [Gemmataceae bacterium]|jgi:lipopolysaccharide export system permease protein
MIIKLIDRQMIRGYFKSYFVCLASLLSLYVVVDLFTNLDDFTSHSNGLWAALLRIFVYYGYKVAQIFDRLCEAIVLLAAMFTVAWMQRNNEQVPLLSAGISTRRIVLPVLLSAFFMLSLTVINQEFIIPRIADKLALERDDPGGEKSVPARMAYESNQIHIAGERAMRRERTVSKFCALIPETLGGTLIHLVAEEARYVPGPTPRQGGWELVDATPREVAPIPGILDQRDSGRYFLHTREVDFEAVTRNPNWFIMASTPQLYNELQRPESTRLAAMAVLFHMRLTRPILGMVLVLLGLSVILRDQNRNVIISSGMCLVLCGVFFAVCYACKMLGDNEYLNPALAAWLPVLFFGPHALVLFDAVHT